jgi:hypothetical protein
VQAWSLHARNFHLMTYSGRTIATEAESRAVLPCVCGFGTTDCSGSTDRAKWVFARDYPGLGGFFRSSGVGLRWSNVAFFC